MYSNHYSSDRQAREALINQIGLGEVVAIFYEEGRRHGDKIRIEVTNTAIVSFYTEATNKLITRKIARPTQLQKYWGEATVPKYLMRQAIIHKRMGFNEI